jgi:hypothetical protein
LYIFYLPLEKNDSWKAFAMGVLKMEVGDVSADGPPQETICGNIRIITQLWGFATFAIGGKNTVLV